MAFLDMLDLTHRAQEVLPWLSETWKKAVAMQLLNPMKTGLLGLPVACM